MFFIATSLSFGSFWRGCIDEMLSHCLYNDVDCSECSLDVIRRLLQIKITFIIFLILNLIHEEVLSG